MNPMIYLFAVPITAAATVLTVNLLRGKSFGAAFYTAVGIGAAVDCLMRLVMLAKTGAQ